MKKLSSKGFTLIELLAVITIMGILMMVAIPAIGRTIENTRRDTFMNTAKSYVNAVKTSVAADEVKCGTDNQMLSALGAGYYFIKFDSSKDSGKDLMEQGGKSSWGNSEVRGVVVVHKKVENQRNEYEYAVIMVDVIGRGIGTADNSGTPITIKSDTELSRTDVKTANDDNRKAFYDKLNDALDSTDGNPTTATKWNGSTALTTPTRCSIVM